MKLRGYVWKFGDNVGSDYFISPKYDSMGRKGQFSELATHILEDVNPTFVTRVQRGDLLVVGKSFGSGKHLGSLIGAFKELGIGGVIAESFAAAWERASINAGLPALIDSSIQLCVESGDLLELNLDLQQVNNLTHKKEIRMKPVPEVVLQILRAGGLEPFTMKRLGIQSG